jgi:hypothetical protein
MDSSDIILWIPISGLLYVRQCCSKPKHVYILENICINSYCFDVIFKSTLIVIKAVKLIFALQKYVYNLCTENIRNLTIYLKYKYL